MQEDLILKYIAEHSIAHPTDLEERFEGAYTALLNLQKYHLIELAVGRKYSVTLTKEGVRASTLGFEQYLKSVNINTLLIGYQIVSKSITYIKRCL